MRNLIFKKYANSIHFQLASKARTHYPNASIYFWFTGSSMQNFNLEQYKVLKSKTIDEF
jgi:hypothetical protein